MPPSGRMKGIPLLEGGDKSPLQKKGQRFSWNLGQNCTNHPVSKSKSVTEQPINYRGFVQLEIETYNMSYVSHPRKGKCCKRKFFSQGRGV